MAQPASSGFALPALVDRLAGELVAVYASAEQALITDLARIARQDARAAQLVMLTEMRRAAERVATALRLRAQPLAARIATEAAEHGDAAALATLRRMLQADPALAKLYTGRSLLSSGHSLASANAIALDLQVRLWSPSQRLTRFADDAYRAAISSAASALARGDQGLTIEAAQNLAWRQLTARGITGYRDTAGRNWNLSSYVEMAARTAVQRAYNAAHQDRMTAVGIHYFTVPSDGHPCPLCRPWEGAILSAGRVGTVTERAADSDRLVAFTVTATIEEARAAGLWHPNCRHVLQPYLPGVTKAAGPNAWTAQDQARYDATQGLRALERSVRAAKRQYAAALNDLDKQAAARRVRALQARIRAHVEAHDLVRRSRREQLDLGNR